MPTQEELLAQGIQRALQNPYGAGPANPYRVQTPPPVDNRALAMQDFAAQEQAIANKQRIAESLMAQSQQRPGLIQAGRVSVAGASPFTALAQGLTGYMGGKAAREAREKTSALQKAMDARAEAQAAIAREEQERALAAAAAEQEYQSQRDAVADAQWLAEHEQAERLAMAKLESQERTAASKGGKDAGLTSGQIQTGLKDLRKDINAYMPIIQGVNHLNSLLTALPDPNSDIPGIGAIEGGSNPFASAVRYFSDIGGDGQGQKIHAAWTGTIAPLIREQAGLAQTRTELERVEQTYGANWMTDEDVFRQQYPQIMKAIQADLETQMGTTRPEVRQAYEEAMAAQGAETVFDKAKFSNPFEVPKPTTQEEFDAIPSGAVYIDPDDGKRYTKP